MPLQPHLPLELVKFLWTISGPRSFPPHAGEGPSIPDPFPRDAVSYLYRWPAASPQALLLPRPLQLCAGTVPDLSRPLL